LRASGTETFGHEKDRAALSATLRAFGGHFAAHAGLLLGPASADADVVESDAEQRRAA
jgi:hypothetical protein